MSPLIFVIILSLVCLLGFFNEKVTKLTYEISLMLFSVVVGILLLIAAVLLSGTDAAAVLDKSHYINIEGFLMNGVLCFMLFAGSCHMKLSDFKEQARQVTVLAFVCTLIGAVFYGALFYGISALLSLNLSLPVCLMFGSIVAPTDPIAATSILSKFGLPEKISFLIQGESLFNRCRRGAFCLLFGNGDCVLFRRIYRNHVQRDTRSSCRRRNSNCTVLFDVQKYKKQDPRDIYQSDVSLYILCSLRVARIFGRNSICYLRHIVLISAFPFLQR